MNTDVRPDVEFLKDSLVNLSRLTYRQLVDNPTLVTTVLQLFTERRLVWIVEKPDVWRDVLTILAHPTTDEQGRTVYLVDCEEIASLIVALLLFFFGRARAGIRETGEYLTHALAGDEKNVYDACPMLGMKFRFTADLPAQWADIQEKPMFHTVGTIAKDAFTRLLSQSTEQQSRPVSSTGDAGDGDDADTSGTLETGASLADSLAGYLIPGSLVSKVTALEAELKNQKRFYDGCKNDRKADQKKHADEIAALKTQHATVVANLQKELAAAKKFGADCQNSVNVIRNDRNAAQAAVKTEEQKRIDAEKAKAATEAFLQACQQQLQQLQARFPQGTPEYERIAPGFDLFKPENAQVLAYEWGDNPEAMLDAWNVYATGAAYLRESACCDSCAHGGTCESECSDGSCDVAGAHATGDSSNDTDSATGFDFTAGLFDDEVPPSSNDFGFAPVPVTTGGCKPCGQ